MREPERGAHDPPSQRGTVSLREAYRELLTNRTYVWTVLGYVAYTFAIGGLAFWAPSYLQRVRGMDQGEAATVFGGITVVAGFIGTLVGGFVGDRLQAKSPNGYTLLSVVSMAGGGALALAAFLTPDRFLFFVLLAAAELLLFANTGPVNALIINSVRPGVRATAAATSVLAIHLGGDLLSPTLIGMRADRVGLGAAILIVPVVFWIAGLLWFGAWTKNRAPGS